MRRFIYITAPIVTILFNLMVLRDNPPWLVLAFWLPYYLLLNRSLRTMSSDLSNQHWNSVADTVLFPYLMGPIIAEQAGLKQKKFVITEKRVMGNRARATFVFGLPHILFLVAVIGGIINVLVRSISSGTLYNPILLFWLVIGAKNLIFALFFMWGRDNFRLASRFYFADPITVICDKRTWTAMTSDASETGISFYFGDPQFIPEDTPVQVVIRYQERDVTLQGKVVHIAPAGNKWRYSVHFDKMPSESKRYYREYVYDRPHSLPKEIDPSVSLLDDFNLRLGKRTQPIQDSMRKLPRVRLDLPFTLDGKQGMLVDFNYRYANVQIDKVLSMDDVLEINIFQKFSIRLARAQEDAPHLYRVLDSERYAGDEIIAPVLTHLMHGSPREKADLEAKATVYAGALTQST